jgi:hypothetical protein
MVTAAGAVALGCAALAVTAPNSPVRRLARVGAVLAGAGWLVGTGEFAARRIAPGPATAREVGTMIVTSALIPPLALGHWLRGWIQSRASVAPDRRSTQ